MDLHSGAVAARPIERNNLTTFCAFRDSTDAEFDASLAIHVILDNGLRDGRQTKAWFAAHPRVVHHISPHASWSQPDRAVLPDPPAQAKTPAFISDYHQTAKPVAWTCSGNLLKLA